MMYIQNDANDHHSGSSSLAGRSRLGGHVALRNMEALEKR